MQHAGVAGGGSRRLEHANVWLVNAHVLGGDYVGEIHAKRFGGLGEEGVVDVGDHHQVEALAQAAQRRHAVVEGGPFANAGDEAVELGDAGGETQPVAEPSQHVA